MQQPAEQEDSHRSTRSDALQKTTQLMAKLHVAGLPRNYELFHEALFGHNTGLSREVLAIGQPQSQSFLDEIGLKYTLASHCGAAADRAQTEASGLVAGAGEQISLGLTQKKTFVRALDTIARSLKEEHDDVGMTELAAEVEFLKAAVNDLIVAETSMSQKLAETAARLATIEKNVDNARSLTLRDRLTALANRAAFANTLDALYNSETTPAQTALIVADVNQFGAINQQYGQAAGNKLLKRLADIFRASIKKHDFVARVGSDEFAFLFTDVNAQAATSIAERLRTSVESAIVFANGPGGARSALTLSMGVALSSGAVTARELQAQAELALAAARGNPRTPVIVYSPELTRVTGRQAA